MAPMVWSWHMVVEITVATADSVDSSCDIGGQSTSILGDLPVVRYLAVSWNPRSSSSWGASSGELADEAELEVSLRAHCSSSRQSQALFCWLELQLQQHHLRSPRLQGILPIEAATQDDCTLTYFRYSGSVWLLALPVVSKGVGGSAGSSTNTAVVVTRVANSSSDVAGVVIRVADMFSIPEGAMVKTAGSSTSRGLVGLGWVSLTSTPGNPYVRPSKTSQPLKVVYLFMHCLNSCMLIAKWQGSVGTGGLAFSAQYWRACAYARVFRGGFS